MTAAKPAMKMPELLVFARPLIIGFVGAEVWRISFCLGANFTNALSAVSFWWKAAGILIGVLLCLTYAFKRGAHDTAAKMGRSLRVDLLVAVGIGIWTNQLVSPWLAKAHTALKNADPYWAPVVLLLLCLVLFSPLARQYWPKSKRATPPPYFIADEEIGDEEEDLLASKTQARSLRRPFLQAAPTVDLSLGSMDRGESARRASSTLLSVIRPRKKEGSSFVDLNLYGTHPSQTSRIA